MGIKSYIATKARQFLDIKDPKGWPIEDNPSGERVNERTAMGLSTVWACVNLLSGTISSLPLMVYRTKGDGTRVVARDHPLYRLLHDSPNYDQTAVDFWGFMVAAIELHGNAVAEVVRSNGAVRGIVPITDPTVSRRRDGVIEYRWTENGRAKVATDTGVLHIRGLGGDALGGMSTLQFNRNAFGLASAIDKSAGSMFRNGMRPSSVVKMDKTIPNQNQRDEIEAGLQRKFTGAMNTGKPMLLEGGLDWKPIGINPNDAQMLESRAFSVEEICRIFGVPPFMVGHTQKVTALGAGLEQQVLGFQKFSLRYRLKRIEQALSKQLLTPKDISDGIVIEFNLEGLLRGDSAARAKFYESMSRMAAMTINEIRALENLPPVPGGDVPRMQAQNIPITEAPEVPSLPAPADDED